MSSVTKTDVLNFIVVGQVRCGASVIQTSVGGHPQAMCLGDLLHPNAAVRQDQHEAYFGVNKDVPQWFEPVLLSPEQYLTTRVFDHPLHGEKAMGFRLSYAALDQNGLWDYLHERSMEGDFVVIHIRRNPLACFISQRQAQAELKTQRVSTTLEIETPYPIYVTDKEFKELVDFCRWQAAHEARVSQLFDDRLEIDYRELFMNYSGVMQEVFNFLDLPAFPEVRPGVQRLKNRTMRERLFSFEHVREHMPPDVRPFFDDIHLF